MAAALGYDSYNFNGYRFHLFLGSLLTRIRLLAIIHIPADGDLFLHQVKVFRCRLPTGGFGIVKIILYIFADHHVIGVLTGKATAVSYGNIQHIKNIRVNTHDISPAHILSHHHFKIELHDGSCALHALHPGEFSNLGIGQGLNLISVGSHAAIIPVVYLNLHYVPHLAELVNEVLVHGQTKGDHYHNGTGSNHDSNNGQDGSELTAP